MKKFVLLFILLTLKAFSQQIVCKGTGKTYSVNYTLGSTYFWSVSGTGFDGNIIKSIPENSITVNWGNTPAGNYTLSVIETNASGCAGVPQTLDILIKDNPVIAASDKEVCAGLTTNILSLVNPTPIGGTYTWTCPKGAVNPGNSASFLAGIGGDYVVTYTDSNGCVSNQDIATLIVNPLPSALITPTTGTSTTFCSGESVKLGAPAGLDYIWNKDGLAISPAVVSDTYTATSSGDYTVTTTDGKGCTATTTTSTKVTVNPLPLISIIPGGALEFCSGFFVNLKGNPLDPFTNNPPLNTSQYIFEWKNDSNVIVSTNQSYDATTTGNYSLTVKDSNSCKATSTPIKVIARPNPLSIISAISATTFCAGNNVTLKVGTGSNYSYIWNDLAGNVVGNTANYLINSTSNTPTTILQYSVKVIDSTYTTNCTTISPFIRIVINALPTTSSITY